MPSLTQTIDLENLLRPLPGEKPAGEDLRYAGLHDDIREARRADTDLASAEGKVADWKQVISLAAGALGNKTKDLQVAAWLSEALVKLHGFPGLRDSLKLMTGLHQHFWENLYPEMDEGDMEARANSMSWFDRQVSFGAREIPITGGRGDNFSFIQWQVGSLPEEYPKIAQSDSQEAAKIKERSDKAAEEWARLFRATPRRFYEETSALLEECRDGYAALDRLMDEKFGRQTPGLSELKKGLEEIRALVDRLVKEKRQLEPDAPTGAAPLPGEETAAGADTSVAVAAGAIRGRQEALYRLAQIAEYFQRTEPHSPVAYLVQRAVKWGNMPLEKWLQDVIKDTSVLDQLQETLGLKTGTESSTS